MVELKVLDHISRQLNDFTTKPFALWNEADSVFINLTEAGRFNQDAYLKNERRRFFDALMATPSYELSIAVDSVLDRLARYWADAKEYMAANPDGIDTDPTAWTLIKVYYLESRTYAAELYYYTLIRPNLETADIFEVMPGLDRQWVRHYLIDKGFITARKFDQLTQFTKPEPDPESQPGKAKATRKNDASANWDATIARVCNLLNGDLVRYDNNQIHWVFKGNASQYAYLALKLQIAVSDTAIRWEYLKGQIIFPTYDTQYKVLKKEASKYRAILKAKKTEGLPAGYLKIDKAFK